MEDNKKLTKYSYSKLDTFDKCPQKFKLKYIDGNYTASETIALEIGSIAHKGEELKGLALIQGDTPDFESIKQVVLNGTVEITEKDKQEINGINKLRQKYFVDFYKKCAKTNMTYDDKLNIYFTNLENKFPLDDWKVIEVEKHFEFIYNDRCILHGFIDRIDMNSAGDVRVIDYKSSNSLFRDQDVKTPLQMVIYALACEHIYGKYPIEFIYDFIFLGEEQQACSKGYLNRGIKKLNKILDGIDECFNDGNYESKPTPLCYWCDFASHTPLANKLTKDLCDNHSLWTPTNKNFKTKNKPSEKSKEEEYNPFKPFRF